nr:amino acid permease [Amycolatopsis taiwanensis]
MTYRFRLKRRLPADGFWATLPLAAWFFFAIESLPMAVEEARNPGKDIPRALVYSFVTLAVVGISTLSVAAGVGDENLPDAADPLVVALQSVIPGATAPAPSSLACRTVTRST